MDETLDEISFTYYDQSSCYKAYLAMDQNQVFLSEQNLDFFYWNSDEGNWSRKNLGEVTQEYNRDWNINQYIVPMPTIAPLIAVVKYD